MAWEWSFAGWAHLNQVNSEQHPGSGNSRHKAGQWKRRGNAKTQRLGCWEPFMRLDGLYNQARKKKKGFASVWSWLCYMSTLCSIFLSVKWYLPQKVLVRIKWSDWNRAWHIASTNLIVVVLVVVMVVVKIIYPRNLQEVCKKGIGILSYFCLFLRKHFWWHYEGWRDEIFTVNKALRVQ
jgi:hypothetical protein